MRVNLQETLEPWCVSRRSVLPLYDHDSKSGWIKQKEFFVNSHKETLCGSRRNFVPNKEYMFN